MSRASYRKERQGTDWAFETRPASPPFPWSSAIFCFVGGFALFVILAGMASRGGSEVLPFVALFAFAIPFIMWKGPKAARYRRPASFVVTPTAIRVAQNVGDAELKRAGIHRLILRNHVSDGELAYSPAPTATVFAGSGVAGMTAVASAVAATALSDTGRQLAARHQNRLAKVSWRLDAESGGRAWTLAGGLDESTAYGLMTEVGSLIGMRDAA